jgi:NAD(P)-dependent dehydrogenase (short-subunit alcohol dehydrogenase family)
VNHDLQGRTAVVTGSGRNIGKAVALELAAHGANVIVNARTNRDEAEAVAEQVRGLGVDALVVMGAPVDKAVIGELQARAEERFGRVDISVSNAARRPFKDFWETSDDDWHEYLNQQLTASWYLAKAFAPGMRDAGWGRIIHMNGPDGYAGGWMRVPHSVAKGGLRTLTKSLARGLGPFGITVNDINPGFTDTVRDPETHPFLIGDENRSRTIERIPVGRPTTPDEIAYAVSFLCSDRAACITGSILHVDGGMSMLG